MSFVWQSLSVCVCVPHRVWHVVNPLALFSLSLSASRLFLSPTVPPKIMPIQAMTNMLREGMRAAISCQILEGDLPVSFRWERNGKPLIGTG